MYYFSLYVVKHYCIIFVFYFFRATGIEFLVAHYKFVPFIRFTIFDNTRLRRWVSGKCDWVYTCSLYQ